MDTDLIYFLLGLILAVPIGIFTTIITPKFQAWVNKRPQVSRAKKIKNLQEELNQITELNKDKELLSLKTTSALFTALFYLSIDNAIWAFPSFYVGMFGFMETFGIFLQVVFSLIAFFFFLMAFIVTLNHIRLIAKLRNYTNYKKELETQIANIQGPSTSTNNA